MENLVIKEEVSWFFRAKKSIKQRGGNEVERKRSKIGRWPVGLVASCRIKYGAVFMKREKGKLGGNAGVLQVSR